MDPEGSENSGAAPRMRRLGYMITLVGSIAFIVGCFLPFYGSDTTPIGPVSFYEAHATFPGSSVGSVDEVTGIVYLFSGAAIVAGLAIAGAIGRRGRWIPVALLASLATWALLRGGLFLQTRWENVEIGYTVMLVGIGVAVLGGVLVIVGLRSDRT